MIIWSKCKIRWKTSAIFRIIGIIFFMTVINFEYYAQNKVMVSGYYAGWMQGWYNNGRLPSKNIDYAALNQIIHFGLVPGEDGSIDYLTNTIREANSDSLIAEAHAANTKVLITIGGWGSDVAFRRATSVTVVNAFVENIITFMILRGYDGIDIDWEVLEASDETIFLNFIKTLRTELDILKPGSIISVATAWQPSIIAKAAEYIDQVNLMTYDLSGPWGGWVTWHNSPVYSGDFTFPSNNKPPPSIDSFVNEFVSAGIPRDKIEIGIDFYGYIWEGGNGTNTGGVTEPRQSWTQPPEVVPNVPYYSIIENNFKPEYYHWDTSAEASYLSLDTQCNNKDMFISYDDQRTCRAKVKYAKDKGLRGVFIWELGGGVTSQEENSQPLLSSIKQEASETIKIPGIPVVHLGSSNQNKINLPIQLSWFPTDGAESYKIQLSDDAGFTNVIIDSSINSTTSVKLQGLAFNQNYYWRVNASNEAGSSDFSKPEEFITNESLISNPVPIEPEDKAEDIYPKVSFKWHPVENAESYFLQISTTNNFCDQATGFVVHATTYTINLEHDRKYYWHVKADYSDSYNSESDYSETRSFTTSSPPPDLPVVISPANHADSVSIHPLFSWGKANYADYYDFQLSDNSNLSNLIIDKKNISQNFLAVKELKPGTSYYWRVRSINKIGVSNWTEIIMFTTAESGDISIVDGGNITAFNLEQNFPNPARNNTTFRFSLPVPSFVSLIIFDPLGKVVETIISEHMQKGMYDIPVHLRDTISSGIYIYTLEATPEKYGKYKPFVSGKKMILVK